MIQSEENVHDNEIISNRFFFQLFKVFRQNLYILNSALISNLTFELRIEVRSGRTATNLCKKVRISAAFEFFFVKATTTPKSKSAPTPLNQEEKKGGGGGAFTIEVIMSDM